MNQQLYQCPCEPRCLCIMNEPCLGCETYSVWYLRHRQLVNKSIIQRQKHNNKSDNSNEIDTIETTNAKE